MRLPPDTEIIKYTSSIVGPKIPGTTNRGRKKTISLDTPSVSVHPPPVPTLSAHQTNTTSSSSLMIEPRKYNRTGVRSIVARVGRNSETLKHKIAINQHLLFVILYYDEYLKIYTHSVAKLNLLFYFLYPLHESVLVCDM